MPINERDGDFYAAIIAQDELGMIARAHIHIEHELQLFLGESLSRPDEIDGSSVTYNVRVRVALAVGLRPQLKKPLMALGTLRNKFAHELGMKLSIEDANNFYATFDAVGKRVIQDAYASMVQKYGRPDDLAALSAKDRMSLYVVSLRSAVISERLRVKAGFKLKEDGDA